MEFSYLIIRWYQENKRDLPWRHTNDPYLVWVSEVILQQTRVEQGIGYYYRFIDRFPDIESLAMAEEEEVMKIWQGLGYYTRARNMHHSARSLHKDNKSEFPASYDEIKKMKGVGDYSASAISSIVFREPHPVIDGNVLRVMTRFEGISDPINSAACKTKIRKTLEKFIDRSQPGIFNQALMELGALICKPKQPLCEKCPIMRNCFANKNESVTEFPVIRKLKPAKTRFFYYLVIVSGKDRKKYTWLNKRTESDIWKNLYDFPLIETEKERSISVIQSENDWKTIFGNHQVETDPLIVSSCHKLSHQELRVVFVQVRSDLFSNDSLIKVSISDIHKYPVPRLIENYLKKIGW